MEITMKLLEDELDRLGYNDLLGLSIVPPIALCSSTKGCLIGCESCSPGCSGSCQGGGSKGE
jgi:hypothetical protein